MRTCFGLLCIVTLTLFFSSPVAGGEAAPIEGPDLLAEEIVRAVNAGDAQAFRRLVHPDCISWFLERDEEDQLNQKMARSLKGKIVGDYHVEIMELSARPRYDPATQRLFSWYFPVPPKKFLQIWSTRPDGQRIVYEYAATEKEGRWYLTLAAEAVSESTEAERQAAELAAKRLIGKWETEPYLSQLGLVVMRCHFQEGGHFMMSLESRSVEAPPVVTRGMYVVHNNEIITIGAEKETAATFSFEGDVLVWVEEDGDVFRLKRSLPE